MTGRIYRIIGCSVTITSDCPEIVKRLDDVFSDYPCGPVQHFLSFTVNRVDEKYTVSWNDQVSERLTNDVQTVLYLHEWVYGVILFMHRDKLCIHAGSIDTGNGMTVLPGGKGSGKTSLVCSAFLTGANVYGDEYVLVKNGACTAVPRKFHLKEKTLDIIPGLRALCADLRSYPASSGGIFYLFDPVGDSGYSFHAGEPPARIVFIEPNHGGSTSLEKMNRMDMVRCLLPEVLVPRMSHGEIISELCSFVNTASCFRLVLGDTKHGIALIKENC